MNTKDEALRLALEALEYIRNCETDVSSQTKYGQAEEVIKQALAQPEPEPVAYVTDNYSRDGVNDEISAYLLVGTKLYTSPPKREPLTGQDYADIYQNCSDWDEFARAIETAHGIKGEA